MRNKHTTKETNSFPKPVGVELKNSNPLQATGAVAVTIVSDLKRLDLSTAPDIQDRLPLIFAALDEGRSAKLKERAAQMVLIYKTAIQDGYISQRDLNLFESAVFNLRDVPFRQIDKKYPPVRNPDYQRLGEEKLVANAALNQWRQAFMTKGGHVFMARHAAFRSRT